MTVAAIGLGLSALSGVVGAVGSIAAGQYQAAVARRNQQVANENAKQEIEAGQAAAQQQQLKTAAVVGAQKAAQGANGLDVNQGSAVDVRASTEELGDLDALTIRNNAARKAYGFKTQAANYGAEASADTMAGYIGGMSSILGSASSVANKWQAYQTAGVSLT